MLGMVLRSGGRKEEDGGEKENASAGSPDNPSGEQKASEMTERAALAKSQAEGELSAKEDAAAEGEAGSAAQVEGKASTSTPTASHASSQQDMATATSLQQKEGSEPFLQEGEGELAPRKEQDDGIGEKQEGEPSMKQAGEQSPSAASASPSAASAEENVSKSELMQVMQQMQAQMQAQNQAQTDTLGQMIKQQEAATVTLLKKLEERQTSQEANMAKMTKDLDRVDKKVESVETSCQKSTHRVEALEKDVKKMSTSLGGLASQDQVCKQQGNVKLKIDGIGVRITRLEERTEKVEAYDTRIIEMKSHVMSLDKQLREHRSNFQGEIEVTFSKMEAKRREKNDSENGESSKNKVKGPDPNIDKLSGRLREIETTVKSSDEIESELRKITERLEEFEGELTAKQESLREMTESMLNNDVREKEMNELQQRCDALEQSLETLKNNDPLGEEARKLRALVDENNQILTLRVNAIDKKFNNDLCQRVDAATLHFGSKPAAPSQEETKKTQGTLENLDKSYEELKAKVAKIEEELITVTRDQLPHSTSENAMKIIRADALQVKNDMMSAMAAFKDECGKATEEKLEVFKTQISSMKTVPVETQGLSHSMQSEASERIDRQTAKTDEATMSQEKKFQKKLQAAKEKLLAAKGSLEDIESCIAASAGDEIDMSDGTQREDKGAHLEESHLEESQFTRRDIFLSDMMDDLKKEMQELKKTVKIDGRQRSADPEDLHNGVSSSGERNKPLINDDRQKQILKAIDRLDKVNDDDSSTLQAQLRVFRERIEHLLSSHPRVSGTKDLVYGATAYAICQKLSQSLIDDFKGHAENGREQCDKYNMPVDLCILMAIDRLIEDHTSLVENAQRPTNIYRLRQQSSETLDSFMTRLLRENRQLSNNKQLVGHSFFEVLVAGINNANLLFEVQKVKTQITVDEEAQRIVNKIKKEVFTQGTATADSTGIMQKHVHIQSSHVEQQQQCRPNAELRQTEAVTNSGQFERPYQDYDEDNGEDEEACIHQMQTSGRGLPPPNNQSTVLWIAVNKDKGGHGNLATSNVARASEPSD